MSRRELNDFGLKQGVQFDKGIAHEEGRGMCAPPHVSSFSTQLIEAIKVSDDPCLYSPPVCLGYGLTSQPDRRECGGSSKTGNGNAQNFHDSDCKPRRFRCTPLRGAYHGKLPARGTVPDRRVGAMS